MDFGATSSKLEMTATSALALALTLTLRDEAAGTRACACLVREGGVATHAADGGDERGRRRHDGARTRADGPQP